MIFGVPHQRHDLQVIGRIVQPIPIDMMDNLALCQESPNLLFSYQSMLVNHALRIRRWMVGR